MNTYFFQRKKDKNFAKDFVDAIKRLVERVKSFVTNRYANTEYGKALLQVADDLYSQIQQLWNEAVESGLEAANARKADNEGVKYSDRSENFQKALARDEWKEFYNSISGDNHYANNNIGKIGVYLPNSNKLVVYNGNTKKPAVKGVYNLGDYEYNIHDGKDNIMELFINEWEVTDSVKSAEAILQEYTDIYGTVFERYDTKNEEYTELTRTSIANRKTNKPESSGRGVSDGTGQTGEVKFQDRDYSVEPEEYGDLFDDLFTDDGDLSFGEEADTRRAESIIDKMIEYDAQLKKAAAGNACDSFCNYSAILISTGNQINLLR